MIKSNNNLLLINEQNRLKTINNEMKLNEIKTIQEWRKFEDRLSIMDVRMRQAKDARNEYLNYLQLKYPQWKSPIIKSIRKSINEVITCDNNQQRQRDLVDELLTSKYHWQILDKQQRTITKHTNKLVSHNKVIINRPSPLLKTDLDSIRFRLNQISDDLNTLRHNRMHINTTDLFSKSVQNIDNIIKTTDQLNDGHNSLDRRKNEMNIDKSVQIVEKQANEMKKEDEMIVERLPIIDEKMIDNTSMVVDRIDDTTKQTKKRAIVSFGSTPNINNADHDEQIVDIVDKSRQQEEPTQKSIFTSLVIPSGAIIEQSKSSSGYQKMLGIMSTNNRSLSESSSSDSIEEQLVKKKNNKKETNRDSTKLNASVIDVPLELQPTTATTVGQQSLLQKLLLSNKNDGGKSIKKPAYLIDSSDESASFDIRGSKVQNKTKKKIDATAIDSDSDFFG